MSIEQDIKTDDKKKKVKVKPYTEVETRVRELATASIENFRKYVFPEAYEIIKAKSLFAGDIRAAHNALWHTHKTAAVYPLISSIFDNFASNLYDSATLPRVSARDKEDIGKSQMAQDFCDWAYDVSEAEHVVKLARNEGALIGTSYGIAGWDKRTHKTKYNVDGEIKTKERPISQPLIEHVSFFEMFYDISTTNFEKARRKVRRKILSLSEIEKRYSSLGIEFTEQKKDEIIENKNDVISTLDFTKIYEIKNYEHLYDDASFDNGVSFLEENVLTSITDSNPFCEVIEYWEADNLVIMINGREYYDDASPYPNGDPFAIIVYEEIPGTCRGVGIGQKLMPHQKQASFYFSKIKDAIGQHIDPMYYVYKGSIVAANGRTPQTISWIPGKVFELADPTIPNGGIKPIEFIDFNIVNIAVWQLADAISRAQETIGTNSYVQWGQGKVERSFGAVNMKVAVTATRLKPLNNSIGKFNEKMFTVWLSLATEFLDDEFSVKVLWDNWFEYRDITPTELIDKFDITVDIEAIRDLTKAERSQTLMNMLNTIAPFNMNPISQTPTIAPESIIKFIAGQLDYEWFNPMTMEERTAYVEEHMKIAQEIQQKMWGQEQAPMPWQEMQMPEMWETQAPVQDIPFDQLPTPF